MKFEKVYDNHYTNWLIGYKFDGGYILKDSHLTYNGNEIVEGYSVETEQFGGKRLFYAGTLKEAKKYVYENM